MPATLERPTTQPLRITRFDEVIQQGAQTLAERVLEAKHDISTERVVCKVSGDAYNAVWVCVVGGKTYRLPVIGGLRSCSCSDQKSRKRTCKHMIQVAYEARLPIIVGNRAIYPYGETDAQIAWLCARIEEAERDLAAGVVHPRPVKMTAGEQAL